MYLPPAVTSLACKPGWAFRLESGWTSATGSAQWPDDPTAMITTGGVMVILPGSPVRLVIAARVADSSSGEQILLEHRFDVPCPDQDQDWARWLLDRILDVERHEAMEFYRLGGRRVFFPDHGDPAALYTITPRLHWPGAGITSSAASGAAPGSPWLALALDPGAALCPAPLGTGRSSHRAQARGVRAGSPLGRGPRPWWWCASAGGSLRRRTRRSRRGSARTRTPSRRGHETATDA